MLYVESHWCVNIHVKYILKISGIELHNYTQVIFILAFLKYIFKKFDRAHLIRVYDFYISP